MNSNKSKTKLFVLSLAFFTMSLAHAGGYTNSIGMEFVDIKPGCFNMGRDPNFEDGSDDELPRHRVCIDEGFQLGKTEVTQAQWVSVMGNNPSKFKGRDNPVEQVSWHDARKFISRLNNKEGGSRYRLPSEAEWEYAARAGSSSTYHFGDDKGSLGQYAWFDDNSGERTHPVAQKRANQWGLYDMHGNVWEWVQDCYHENYRGAPGDGSVWSSSCYKYDDGEILRVLRGGGWLSYARYLRSASRLNFSPGARDGHFGFRLLRQP